MLKKIPKFVKIKESGTHVNNERIFSNIHRSRSRIFQIFMKKVMDSLKFPHPVLKNVDYSRGAREKLYKILNKLGTDKIFISSLFFEYFF